MFEFAWPWLFLLLPLPWLLHALAAPIRQQGVELSVPFYNDLYALALAERTGWRRWRKISCYSLIWILLVLAAARPQLHGSLQERPSTGRDLLIAVDVSSSMLYSDMSLAGSSISRMAFIKLWLEHFIDQRHGDRLGLILFGSQAYLQAPLTYDHHSVKIWVQEAQPGIAGNTTSIGDAIGLAIKRLRMRPAEQRVLILITDGANNSGVMSPLAAAQLAARYHIKIYTVGVGNRTDNNLHEMVDSTSFELDEDTLKHIAAQTGGHYFHLTDSNDLAEIQNSLSALEPSADYQAPKRNVQELYSWPLALALLFSVVLACHQLYRRHVNAPRSLESK